MRASRGKEKETSSSIVLTDPPCQQTMRVNPDSSKLTKPSKREFHKCEHCYTRGSEVPLRTCARCKRASYCSKECQKAHWPTHKEVCELNVAHTAAIESVFNPLNLIPLPEGMTLSQLNQRLEKWVKFHSSTMLSACIHALSLPKDLSRTRTHVVRIRVSIRKDHGNVAAKYFRITNAWVIEIAEAEKLPDPWRESLEQVAKLREESERMRRGTIAAAGIECPPLDVQFVPFGSLMNLSPLIILPNWKEVLIRDVENGKKFTRFGY